MNKRIITIFLAFFFVLFVSPFTYAEEEIYVNNPRVSDFGEKLTDEEENDLTLKSQSICKKYQFDCYCLTVPPDTDGRLYSFDAYSQLVQYSGRTDAVILYIENNGTSDIITFYEANSIYNDDVKSKIKAKISSDVENGDIYGAFDQFLYLCDKYAEQYFAGNMSDIIEDDKESGNQEDTNPYDDYIEVVPIKDKLTGKLIICILLGIGSGCIVSYFICGKLKNDMNNIRTKVNADEYLEEKLNLTVKKERIIKRTVSKRKLENNK